MSKKFNRENVLKGELLWKRLHKAYIEQTELAHKNSAPFTGVMELFSRDHDSQDPVVSVNIFSDGAGLGNYNSRTGKGLTGYGYGFIAFQSGKVIQPTILRGEYKFRPATVAEAEGFGALKGVVHAKAAIRKKSEAGIKINLTTDCLNLIEGLHNMPSVLRKISEISDTPIEQRSNYIRSKYNELKIIRDLANELYNDPLIVGVTTHWVKGHILDSTPLDELKYVEDYLNHKISTPRFNGESQKFRDEKMLFHNMRNNKMADKKALEGAVRGLTKRIDYLANKDHDSVQKEREAIRTSIALTNSVSARMIAIEYIAGKPEGYLENSVVSCLIGDNGSSEIEKKRAKMCNKYNCKKNDLPGAILADHKGSFEKVVISDYLGSRETSFIRKFGALKEDSSIEPSNGL